MFEWCHVGTGRVFDFHDETVAIGVAEVAEVLLEGRLGVAGASEFVSLPPSTPSTPNRRFDTGSPVSTAVTIGTDSMVYAANADGRIVALEDGQPRWRYDSNGSVTNDLVLEDALYAVSSDRVFALTPETG